MQVAVRQSVKGFANKKLLFFSPISYFVCVLNVKLLLTWNILAGLQINEITFEQLFNEHYDSLYYYVYSIVNDADVAKDIVNDSFLEIWNRKRVLDISYSLKYFLYKVAKNKSLNYLRKLKVEKRYIETNIGAPDVEEENVDYEDVLVEVMKAIEQLPTQARTVFKKCFIENLSYREAADELGVSINTIKTHVRHSLKKLRNEIDKDLILIFIHFSKKM
jgi:RNA polymerase sigma-70 factor (ECF subfamily)